MCTNCGCQSGKEEQSPAKSGVTRRAAVGVVGAGAGAVALTACGSSMDADVTAQSVDPGAPEQATDMAAVADVPVGGVIKATAGQTTVMISQPTEGVFHAFSSVCTHQGCQINAQKEKVMNCPCHSSVFSLEDGSPQGGPAETALPEFKVEIKGDRIWVS
ncbi:MAG: Rieske (2Fe-2S) protein [Rothia sp. (in: high G+C Gram-positive bacteria)]|nr:Rieske (2Fe-2S) protein [Rothia sp. (in: high G+C Gram-positive bacteria)]